MRKWQWAVGLAFIVLAAALTGLGHAYKKFLNTPLISNVKPVTYVFKSGSSVKVLAKDLATMGVIENPQFLIVLAHWKGIAKKLKAGEYLFSPGITPNQLLEQIAAGKVVYHRFTIVEGWTFNQILSVLAKESLLINAFSKLTPAEIVAKLKLPPGAPEGLFFPATYHYTLGTSDIAIMQKAYQTMSAKLKVAWQQRASNLPYKDVYEALIVASLIEKEAGQTAERPLISSVIINRLKKHMPLQIDSSVIYGLGNAYTGKLHTADLRLDSPYNTYTRRGLPPTPIGMPGEQSIHAALHPATTEALYFVAKGNGTHQFSNTLQAHNKAVVKYQIDMVLPKVGQKNDKVRCPQKWYLNNSLHSLLSVECQLK